MAKETNPSTPEKAVQASIGRQEAEYSAAEFAVSARVLFGRGATPDCVIAAFRTAGIEKATKGKAKEIVSKFLQKEVK